MSTSNLEKRIEALENSSGISTLAINSCNCNEEELRASIAALQLRLEAIENKLTETPIPEMSLKENTLVIKLNNQ